MGLSLTVFPAGAQDALGLAFGVLAVLLVACAAYTLYLLRERRKLGNQQVDSARITEANRATRDQATEEPPSSTPSAQETIEQFSHHIAHELAGPLGSIDLLAFLAEQHLSRQDPDAARRELGRLRDQVRDAHATVSALLRLANPVNPQHIEDTDLTALAQAAERDARLSVGAQSEGLLLAPVSIADLGQARTDPELLRLVLTNLLTNALKFNLGRAGVTVRVGRHDAQSSGAPSLYVSDNGIGFDAAMIDPTTGSFWRFPQTRHVPGHGLGLQIVRRALTRLGGALTIEAKPGEGTRVTFTLGK